MFFYISIHPVMISIKICPLIYTITMHPLGIKIIIVDDEHDHWDHWDHCYGNNTIMTRF